jgi:hypothetical protein
MTTLDRGDYDGLDVQQLALDDFDTSRLWLTRTGGLSLSAARKGYRYQERLLIASEPMTVFFPEDVTAAQRQSTTEKALKLAVFLGIKSSDARENHDDDISVKVRATFEGATVLKAYVLTFGYPTEDVLLLSAEKVEWCFAVLADTLLCQLPFSTMLDMMSADIDTSLAVTILNASCSKAENDHRRVW